MRKGQRAAGRDEEGYERDVRPEGPPTEFPLSIMLSQSCSPRLTLLTSAQAASSLPLRLSVIASLAMRMMDVLVLAFSGVLSSEESSSPTIWSSGKCEKMRDETRAWQV